MKLYNAVAIRKGRKAAIDSEITRKAGEYRKAELFNGLIRKYEAKDVEGEAHPEERKRVQVTYQDTLDTYRRLYGEIFDLEAQVEDANTRARGSVVVDGKVVLADVPAGELIFLEKKLLELRKCIEELPVL